MRDTVGPLSGKTAFITGGSGAIGSASALRFLTDGAAVMLMGRRQSELDAARARLLSIVPAGQVEVYSGDARSAADMSAAIRAAASLARGLDIIVAGVGGGRLRPILMHDESSFMEIVSLNVATAFLAIRHGAPLLPRGGAIICISSVAASNATPWMAPYMAGKGAVEQLVRCAAEELSEAGIRVNAVRPGLTRTELGETSSSNPQIVAEVLREIPLGRIGEPDDIGWAVRYLAGPEAAWVTGQVFAVDGGSELRKNAHLIETLDRMYGVDSMAAVRAGQTP